MQLNETITRFKDYDFLNTVLTNLPAVAFVIAPDGTILFIEGKSIPLAGLNRDDFLGTNVSQFSQLYPELESKLRRTLEGETITTTVVAPSQRDFEITYSPMRDDQGSICGVIGVAQDVTERRKTELELRDSEEKFRSITSTAIDAIMMMDQTGRISLWNEAAQVIFGYTEQEAIGQDLNFLVAPKRYHNQAMSESFASRGKSPLLGKVIELTAKRKSGEEFPLELSLSAFRLHGQWHAVGTARDITERKRAEQQLRESEEKFSKAFQSNAALMAITDIQTNRFIDVNETFVKVLGFTRDETVGRTAAELGLFADKGRRQVAASEVEKGRSVRNFEATVRAKSSELRYGIFSAEKMVLQGADCMMTVMVDITERKQAEEALRESEEKFRKIFDDGPVGMVMAGKDYRFIRVNAAFCRMLGYSASELTSLTFKDITHPEHLHEDSKSVMQVVNAEIPRYCTEKRYIRKDKETVWGALTLSAIRSNDGQLLYCLAMIEDITERKRAQEEKDWLQQQLQQSQKLEAIGTMAGGIAHDFNNILSAMLGFTELVRSEIPEDSESYENLTEVVRAGQRARDLVSQILSFTRKAQTEKSVISLVTIVSEALKFTRSIIPSHITIQQNFAVSAEHSILADPTQMHQIMLNLCINAADAMPDGGVLEISLEESQVQTENRPEQTPLPSGRYLKLTVRDSGVGMTPDVLERVFEPYFTTKQAGKGTGMGLAVVHGVVKEHGGNITVSSEVGKGTAVTVWLPVAEAASRTPVVSAPVITTGSGSILFVDDETVIVNLQRTQLNKWGYRVTATASSATALDMFRANPQGFDLVITDLTMPGITGIKLAEAIHEISPSTPIVLCTGFDEGISRENARMIGIRAILSKPISGAELSRTIRLVLDRAFESSPAKS